MVNDIEGIRTMMGWTQPPKKITPVVQTPVVQAKKCKIISLYIPSYSYLQDMSEEEWNKYISSDAVARWQAANPVCPF